MSYRECRIETLCLCVSVVRDRDLRMMVFRAAWVLPIAVPPIRDGWVAVEAGTIRAAGSGPRSDAIDLGRVAVLPALVNAHTHLELSYLRGAVPPAGRFVDWIRAVMAARREHPDPRDETILAAARAALQEARASGTGLLGDISNTLVTVGLLQEAPVSARVFYELLGFNIDDPAGRVRAARGALDALDGPPGRIRLSLAPHAPYSVAPGLFAALREDLDGHVSDVTSVHLAEAADETEFLRDGTGAWRELLGQFGVLPDGWRPPGRSTVAYLTGLGFLDSRVLAVHAVQCTGDDLAVLKALGTTVVSCPRSNRWVGAGDPPLDAFYAAGVPVAFGTDSLASVDDLNLFGELARARVLAPRVPARALLESATRCGARALGFGDRLGTIEPGKEPSLIAVRVPSGVGDVEEYLVSGIQPDAIRWLDL